VAVRRALAAIDGSDLDVEMFYCGSLLHDHGIAQPATGVTSRSRARTERSPVRPQLEWAMIRAEAAVVPQGRFGLLVRCGLPLAVRMAPFAS
jgi:hypothetical protein